MKTNRRRLAPSAGAKLHARGPACALHSTIQVWKNRLDVSISGLRKAGIGDAIVASNDRYRLCPNTAFVVVRTAE